LRPRKKPLGHKSFSDYNAFASSEESWRSKAACAKEDTSLFFSPSKSIEAKKALLICSSCPVVDECFHNAMQYQYHGIWGGFTEEARQKILQHLLNNDLTDFTLQRASLIRREFIPVNTPTKRVRNNPS